MASRGSGWRGLVAAVSAFGLACFAIVAESTGASAYCTYNQAAGTTGYKWPSTSITVTGQIYWNPTTRDYIDGVVAQWTNVTPSPLKFGSTAWVTTIPAQTPGLKLTNGRFAGDDGSPATSSASTTKNHTSVTVIFSTYAARWTWSNTVHDDNGQINLDGTWKGTGPSTADIRTVAIHEVGHSVGLAHPYQQGCNAESDAEKKAVMHAQWDGPRRTLATDDKSGLNGMGY